MSSRIPDSSADSSSRGKKERRQWSRKRKTVIWSMVFFLLLSVYYICSPYLSGVALVNSIEEGDSERLAELVDFARLRKDVKEYLQERILQKSRQKMNEKPGILSFLSAGPKQEAELMAMRATIDRRLTPEGIIELAQKYKSGGASDSLDEDWSIDGFSFTGWGTLQVDIHNIRLHVERSLLDWRICGCEALPDFEMPANFSFKKPAGDGGSQ